MIPLTGEETKSYEKQKVCLICKKEFSTDKNDKNTFKQYHKIKDHCHNTGKFRETLLLIMRQFTKTLLMMLKNGLTYLTIKKMIKDRFQ